MKKEKEKKIHFGIKNKGGHNRKDGRKKTL